LGEAPTPRRPWVPVNVRATGFQKTHEIKTNVIEIPPMAAWRDVPQTERHENLVALVRGQLAEMLRFDSPERIDRKRRLMDLGLDSLMAVELRGRITNALGLEKPLSATIAFDYPTLDALADHLEDVIVGIVGPEPVSLADPLAARADELEHLDEEEIEALLLKKLQSL
jgi:acyl carrier protein